MQRDSLKPSFLPHIPLDAFPEPGWKKHSSDEFNARISAVAVQGWG
jgi:hypothetical protein